MEWVSWKKKVPHSLEAERRAREGGTSLSCGRRLFKAGTKTEFHTFVSRFSLAVLGYLLFKQAAIWPSREEDDRSRT